MNNVTAPGTGETIESLLVLIQKTVEKASEWLTKFFEGIIGVSLPEEVETSLGILLVLTVFLAGAEFSRKILWFVVAVGWFLLSLKIAVMALNIG